MFRSILAITVLSLCAAPAFAGDNDGERKRGCDCEHRRPGHVFDKLDKNDDGVLTADEAPKVVEKADADGDGQVTKDEAKAAFQKHREHRRNRDKA